MKVSGIAAFNIKFTKILKAILLLKTNLEWLIEKSCIEKRI